MLDSLLTDLSAHCERIVTRLDDIESQRVLLRQEEQSLRAELKAGHRIFQSAKKTIDQAVQKHNERRRPVGRRRLVKAS